MHDRIQGTPTAHGRTAQRFLSIIVFADARHIVRAAAKQIANILFDPNQTNTANQITNV